LAVGWRRSADVLLIVAGAALPAIDVGVEIGGKRPPAR
jgi:hypothetical protein